MNHEIRGGNALIDTTAHTPPYTANVSTNVSAYDEVRLVPEDASSFPELWKTTQLAQSISTRVATAELPRPFVYS